MPRHDPCDGRIVRCEITLWVSRGAAGDLAAGARDVLSGVETIASITRLEVREFRPTATDIRVDLVVDARVNSEDDRIETRLADGFGIITANVQRLEGEPDARRQSQPA